MKGKRKRKIFSSGEITSYKFPVLKGNEGEAFYHWINHYEKYGYKSMNRLITEALKLKFMADHMRTPARQDNADQPKEIIKNHGVETAIFDVEADEIDILNQSSISPIAKTFESIKR